MNESSTLKAYEYCSRGMPFILSSPDPQFPDDFLYIYKPPADETPLSIDEIIHFTTAVCGDLGHSKKMHEFALKNLDWSIRMKKLKEFLESMN
jgi:hypothetical protein